MRAMLAVLLLIALAFAGMAEASRRKDPLEQPMKVVLVRSSDAACEPTCPEWIMAEGAINAHTAEDFVKIYLKAQGRMAGARPPVILRSPGGNIIAALQIGYFLRARGFDVGVGTTIYTGCAPFAAACQLPAADDGVYRGHLTLAPAYCLSACPLILAAGAKRLAGPEAMLGIHHWGYDYGKGRVKYVKTKNAVAWDGAVRRMISDYLAAMGNAGAMVAIMDDTPFASLHPFTVAQRKAIGLVSGAGGARLLTAVALCRRSEVLSGPPHAANCILQPPPHPP